MNTILIVGAGGVGSVAAHKCAQLPEIFQEIHLASRTLSKCHLVANSIRQRTGREISTFCLDADNLTEAIALLHKLSPDVLLNLALPYQNLTLMEACLATGTNYLDTANYEHPEIARFEYKSQWRYHERFREKNICALLGSGFDPGVTNVFTSFGAKHYFDEINELDIIDVNGGENHEPFSTNFNPEINIREVSAACRHWEGDQFVESPAFSTHRSFSCPEGIGDFEIYRMYHEELESLTVAYPSLRRAQFWMSFSPSYLRHLKVLTNVGMTSIYPVDYHGKSIVPLQFLKSILPDPGRLGESTTGQTCIGCVLRGKKGAQSRSIYIYNVCSHESAFRETGSQAVSYTTGVPAMIGAKMILQKKWFEAGVWNMEHFDPDPFMQDLDSFGLSWSIVESDPFHGKAAQ